MKIISFNSHNLGILRLEIKDALSSIEEKYGIKLEIGNISYSNSEFSTKMKAKTISEVTSVPSILEGIMSLHNLQIDGVGGRKLVDYKKSSYKYPFIYSDNGKLYKCDLLMAKMYFSKK